MVTLHPIAKIFTFKKIRKALEYRYLVQRKTKKAWGKGMCSKLGRISKFLIITHVPTQYSSYIDTKYQLDEKKLTISLRHKTEENINTSSQADGRWKLTKYLEDVSTPTGDITTIKPNWNSVILKERSRYMCMCVKYFYLRKYPINQY